ncbi:hypothetical protein QCN29_33960 [Streptomyces sp. HNM0663]|uniref:Uncharacterized protein n=1 Tax=Streptomyces chengmaiensis TaxID=3040919 RepID=A0ABT6HY96_9ACTN|nr:hypothetical protein [Streptomyces chengmaiensis]MDH2393681.1 hypothetical protein [Streptomyces chengmaiensis]
MSGVYEAYPDALRSSIERMRRLPELARKLGEDFTGQERSYVEWPGWTDDFAHEVRPVYESNNEYCLGISSTLFQALDGLVSATLANLENIEQTRTDSTERIREHRLRTEEAVEGDTGGRH